MADLGRCFFSCDVPHKQISKARFRSLQNVCQTGKNSQAQNSLASHISACFTVRNMSSQMSDYPTLQYTTDLYCSKGVWGRRRRRSEKERKVKQSWVVPAALPSVKVMAALVICWKTTFLKSGGDNPRLFPFARPPIAVLVLPAQSEFRVGFVVVIDGWPIPLFALIVAALLWAKWQHLKFEFYMVFLTSWKVPKWDISKSCFINSKELST